MKSTSGDSQNESRETPQCPRVLRIAEDEFQQSVAVAQLAVKLCQLKKAELQKLWDAEDKRYHHSIQAAVTENEKNKVMTEREEQMKGRITQFDPTGFLKEASELIHRAREQVLRPQTAAEYLAEQGGSREALGHAVRRRLRQSYVPFNKLCDENRNKGDTETIDGIWWRVYHSERGFNDLFWDYWRDTGEMWKFR
jgi:hypothetical protein